MSKLKRILSSRQMVTFVWILGVIAIWEIFAFIVAATKRTPVNVLPHLWQIISSFFSDNKVSGEMTMAQLIGSSCRETLLRAGLGFVIGTAAGFLLALCMSLSGIVEKIAFPYLMIIQMIPILGMAPIILAVTGDINVSRIIIAAILTFYPVSTNVLAGFKAVEREKHELMFSYAANKFQLYTKTLIPARVYTVFFYGVENIRAYGDNRIYSRGYLARRKRIGLYAFAVVKGRHDKARFLEHSADKRDNRNT